MDYHNSSTGIAKLAVIKYTAVEPGKSKGSVFMNPGSYPHMFPEMAALIRLGKAVLVAPEPWCSLSSENP